MRAIVLFATLTAVVFARPDVSHLGYKYKQMNGGASTAYSGSNGAAYNGAANGYSDSASFGSVPSSVTTGTGFDNGYNTQISSAPSNNGFTSGSQIQATGQEYTAGTNGFIAGTESAGFSGSSSNGLNNGNNGQINLIEGRTQTVDLTGGSNGGQRVVYKPVIKQGEPIITKNFYVHAAPEEDENVRVEEKVQVVRPQKTYKIIFIKAPSAASAINNVNYPVYPQNEEKTIVYVLSKKDEGISDIGEIPTPPPPVTHKPDVFFIKYKTRQEAADAVANIQSQFQTESQATAAATGSVSDGNNYDSSISETDVRVDNNPTYDQASYDGAVDNGVQNFQTSSQTQFGPSGGQIAIQSGQFMSNGAVHDDQPITQNAYSEAANGGQSYSSDSSSSSAEFVPQNLIKINADQSAFRQQYLPPSACANC